MRKMLLNPRDLRRLMQGRVPGQLVIQFTDHCNARCPQCGMRVTESFPRSRLSTDRIKKIIDGAAEKGVKALSFTGGEPLLFLPELAELIRHAYGAGIPCIRTGTNGFIFAGFEKKGFRKKVEKLADLFAETRLRNFWISIDSADPAIHEKMRGFPGIISGIERVLPIFHERGIYPSANLGINRNISGESIEPLSRNGDRKGNEAAFHRRFIQGFTAFFSAVERMGFTIVNCCYPMSLNRDEGGLSAVYAATAADRVVKFTPREKALMFNALCQVIPRFRSRIRIFSPRSSLRALQKEHGEGSVDAYACRGGIDFFFIGAADGKTYPCGYRGADPMGEFADLDPDAIPADHHCRSCDWECFRDPSELLGPVSDLLSGNLLPLALKWRRDPEMLRLWVEDLLYYRACDFFDGRRQIDLMRLSRFNMQQQRGH